MRSKSTRQRHFAPVPPLVDQDGACESIQMTGRSRRWNARMVSDVVRPEVVVAGPYRQTEDP